MTWTLALGSCFEVGLFGNAEGGEARGRCRKPHQKSTLGLIGANKTGCALHLLQVSMHTLLLAMQKGGGTR